MGAEQFNVAHLPYWCLSQGVAGLLNKLKQQRGEISLFDPATRLDRRFGNQENPRIVFGL